MLMNMFGFRRSLARLLFPSKAGYVSLHKLVTCHREKILSPPKSGKWKNVETLLHKKEKLRDVQDLQERLSKVLSRKMVGTCSLCFDDVPISKLRDACGHCSHRCCEECRKLAIQNSPGQLSLEARARCPFCRSFPIYNVMRYMNREIYAIRARNATLSSGFDRICTILGVWIVIGSGSDARTLRWEAFQRLRNLLANRALRIK